MFDVLKSLNYIQSMDIDPSSCMRTAMRFLTMEFVLTHTGIESYEKVLAIIFEYLRKVREEWMPNGEEIQFFKELQNIINLSWNVYQQPDTEELLDLLSQAMIHTKDPTKLLKDTYAEKIIEKYEPQRIKALLDKL